MGLMDWWVMHEIEEEIDKSGQPKWPYYVITTVMFILGFLVYLWKNGYL